MTTKKKTSNKEMKNYSKNEMKKVCDKERRERIYYNNDEYYSVYYNAGKYYFRNKKESYEIDGKKCVCLKIDKIDYTPTRVKKFLTNIEKRFLIFYCKSLLRYKRRIDSYLNYIKKFKTYIDVKSLFDFNYIPTLKGDINVEQVNTSYKIQFYNRDGKKVSFYITEKGIIYYLNWRKFGRIKQLERSNDLIIPKNAFYSPDYNVFIEIIPESKKSLINPNLSHNISQMGRIISCNKNICDLFIK